ncbi:MAG: SIS domain-containing protein [Anaerolineae bacterium]|nr:SIS domain-containing protein [Anaerolineae bacterium]
MTAETATYREILTQTNAWQQALDVVSAQSTALGNLYANGDYTHIIFTGCGSTYYLSLAAAALFQELTGMPAHGVPAGELALYPQTAYPKTGRVLLVAVSRSAETTETIQAVKRFQQNKQGEVIIIANYGDPPLASMGAVNLIIPAGQEESVAQTRSFASMYVAATALAVLLAGQNNLLETMQQLPQVGQRLMGQYEEKAKTLGRNLALDRFYFLGGGPRYGLACEVNLKMKEMTLTHSEPFHFLEFRHGPISMVGPTALVTGLLSEVNRAHEAAVLADVRQLGGHTLVIGESDTDVTFASHLPEAIRNVLYLPVPQLMAHYRAVAKGLNPDRPNNLETVVKLAW